MKLVSRVLPVVIVVVVGLFAASEWDQRPGGKAGADVSASETRSGTFSAKLVRVFDGDSLIVRSSSGKEIEIRIHAIDAPERNQPFANKSRVALRAMLEGEEITVVQHSVDRYDRVLAKLLVEGSDVGLEQIESGLAWHYKQFAREQSQEDRRLYAAAEATAREQRTGLWKEGSSIPPWDFRRQGRPAG